MFKCNFLIISVFMLVIGLLLTSSYYEYEEIGQDIQKLAQEGITTDKLNNEIEEAIRNNNPKDARMYLKIGAFFGVKLDEKKYLERIRELERPLKTARRKIGQFFKGFIKGRSNTGAGMAGAIVSDFTVIGDIRDLKEQHKIHKEGGKVNKLIVTLAGVGVGLTASTYLSLGATSPQKVGVSTLKYAVKNKKLTKSMQKTLTKQGREAFNTKGFLVAIKGVRSPKKIKKIAKGFYNPKGMMKLRKTARSMNTIRKNTSFADSVHLMKYVKNTKDLRHLEKISLRYGKNTKGLFKLLGRGIIGTLRVLKYLTEFILALIYSIITFLVSSFLMFLCFRKKKKINTYLS